MKTGRSTPTTSEGCTVPCAPDKPKEGSFKHKNRVLSPAKRVSFSISTEVHYIDASSKEQIDTYPFSRRHQRRQGSANFPQNISREGFGQIVEKTEYRNVPSCTPPLSANLSLPNERVTCEAQLRSGLTSSSQETIFSETLNAHSTCSAINLTEILYYDLTIDGHCRLNALSLGFDVQRFRAFSSARPLANAAMMIFSGFQ